MVKELRKRVVGQLFMMSLLRRAYLQRAAKTSGLYFGQLPVLQYINEHDGCPQREVAEQLGVTPASIALSTKRMQKAGLLEKESDGEDQRCKKLHITERGRSYMNDCAAKFDELDARMFDGFDMETLRSVTEQLARVNENLARAAEDIGEMPGDCFHAIRLAHQINARERDLKEDNV